MAQDDRGLLGNLPIAGIAAIVLFASGLVVQHVPLESDRPASNGKQLRLSTDGQFVEARLWQDPFDAIQRHQDECPETGDGRPPNVNCQLPAGASAYHGMRWFRDALAHDDLAGTLVLPVFIYGGPYAEDTEERRRYRYAVLSALRASQYEPANPRAVGFVRVDGSAGCPERKGQAASKDCRDSIGELLDSLLIPFERWTIDPDADQDRQQPKVVVVLWLKEEWFSHAAKPKLEWLFERLLPADLPADQLKLIGPNNVKTADSVFAADHRECPQPDRARLHGECREFTSPALTDPADRFAAVRISPDNGQLVRALVGELANRRLALPTEEQPACDADLALVVESDTSYGRSLEHEVKKALAACLPDDKRQRRLNIYRYFRGLDGKAAFGAESSKKTADSNPRSPKDPQPAAPQERAQGEGQFDYLLRVADAVRERSDKLTGKSRRTEGIEPTPQGIRAVLVLGSDVHDKLAVLHALREKMPSALFATNDLDAGLLQSNRLTWTRNLIVASGYDLDLRDKLQQGAAPFRDTYQTASFLATRLALQPALKDDKSIQKLRAKVRLFEIGNGVAVPLDGKRTAAGSRDRPLPYRLWLWVGAAILAVAGFVVVHSWCARKTLCTHWPILLLVALLCASYVGWVIHTATLPGEEPLSLTGGISVWPSEFIRFGVFLLGAYWICHAFARLKAGDDEIGGLFFNQPPGPEERRSPRAFIRAIHDGLRTHFAGGLWAGIRAAYPAAGAAQPARENKINVGALWDEYRGWTRPTATAVRVALGFLCYLVLSALVVPIDPPVAPLRGPTSALIDALTIAAAALTAGLLLIYTLDRVAISTLFLRRLYGDHDTARDSAWENQAGAGHFCGIEIAAGDNGAEAVAARSYIDLRLSAKLTRSVGGIVLFPFMLTLLLILARSRYFDNWVMPVGLLIVIGFGLSLVTFCAFSLRQSAERIRQLTLEELGRAEIAARAGAGGAAPSADSRISPEQLKLMRDTATNLREGAFAPFAEQPIIRALVLPFGGAGLVSLVDWAILM